MWRRAPGEGGSSRGEQVHIVFRSPKGEHELEFEARSPDATLGDLLQAVLHGPGPSSVAVADRVVRASCPLSDSGLHEGATVTVPPAPPTFAVREKPKFEAAIVAGLDAGRVFPLSAGRSTVGRDAANTIVLMDAWISRRHCEI